MAVAVILLRGSRFSRASVLRPLYSFISPKGLGFERGHQREPGKMPPPLPARIGHGLRACLKPLTRTSRDRPHASHLGEPERLGR